MRHFLILFDDMEINRTSVRAGENSKEVITACRCINVGLFLSGDLRRDVTVSIGYGTLEDLQIVSFSGNSLKRVSPDERSISFFLLKAYEELKGLHLNTFVILDNGIIIQRADFNNFLKSLHQDNIIIAIPEYHNEDSLNLKRRDALLIYDNRAQQYPLESFRLEKYSTIPYPPHPERFILDVNRAVDSADKDT